MISARPKAISLLKECNWILPQLSKTVKQSPQIFENNGTFCADRPFSKNRPETNCQKSFIFNQLVSELQSYILSITTETDEDWDDSDLTQLQSYILSITTETQILSDRAPGGGKLQSYILSTTTETSRVVDRVCRGYCFNRTFFQ